ncbi:transposase [Hyunsoonleella rubra]|uniref:Transposase n=1 Tax=Hyunsoonleella rubra TaxID=1737062 RepID=A0ABW5T7W7_9FLAO
MKYEPLTSGNYYHIYNCGNNKEDIFIEEKNYPYFLNLIKKYIVPVADILSYCLLKNHFHLLIKTKDGIDAKTISRAFSDTFNAYAKSINKSYGRTGSLFRDRFARIRIDDESYLKSLIIYINSNAVQHGFVSNFREYEHSSFHALVSNKVTLVKREFVLSLFDGLENFETVMNAKMEILEELILE